MLQRHENRFVTPQQLTARKRISVLSNSAFDALSEELEIEIYPGRDEKRRCQNLFFSKAVAAAATASSFSIQYILYLLFHLKTKKFETVYEKSKELGMKINPDKTQLICISPAINYEVKSFVQDRWGCLLYTSPSPRDLSTSRMPSSA